MLDYFDFVSILYSIIKYFFFMSEDHVIISKPVRGDSRSFIGSSRENIY